MIWEKKLVCIRFWSELTAEECNQVQTVIFGDIRFDTLRGKVCDLREVTRVMITENDISHLTSFKHGAYLSNPNIRFAYISTDNKIVELINYAKTLTEYELETFPTVDEAKNWIDKITTRMRTSLR